MVKIRPATKFNPACGDASILLIIRLFINFLSPCHAHYTASTVLKINTNLNGNASVGVPNMCIYYFHSVHSQHTWNSYEVPGIISFPAYMNFVHSQLTERGHLRSVLLEQLCT
jgi:hypothetical protein